MTSDQGVFVYIPGSRWENVRGTDHRLAAALAIQSPVHWVDPPLPINLAMRHGARLPSRGYELSRVAPGITRLRSLSVPGFTRPVLALAAKHPLGIAIRAALRKLRTKPFAVMVSAPTAGFPSGVEGTRVLFVTDDWISGASMMGLSRPLVRRVLGRNLADADIAAAVSPYLAGNLQRDYPGNPAVAVVPNGCERPKAPAARGTRSGNAALVGQLNERLDMELLEAVKDAGVPVVVIGPRTDRDPEIGRRKLPAQDLRLLGRRNPCVGNRPSCCPVAEHRAGGCQGRTGRVRRAGEASAVRAAGSRRRRAPAVLCGRHTWHARANQLLELIGGYGQ